MEQQSNNAAKTISVVMLVTLLGKVMGLYRDRLLAIHYSVGVEANAFFTASRIPRAVSYTHLTLPTTMPV